MEHHHFNGIMWATFQSNYIKNAAWKFIKSTYCPQGIWSGTQETMLGCTPQTYKPWNNPASGQKKRAQSQWQASGGLLVRDHTHSKQVPEHPGIWQTEAGLAAVIATGGRGRLPVIGEIDVKLAHWSTGKSAEVSAPHSSLH